MKIKNVEAKIKTSRSFRKEKKKKRYKLAMIINLAIVKVLKVKTERTIVRAVKEKKGTFARFLCCRAMAGRTIKVRKSPRCAGSLKVDFSLKGAEEKSCKEKNRTIINVEMMMKYVFSSSFRP